MTSLLRPAYELTIADQRWTQQLIAIDLMLAAAPRFDRLTATLPSGVPLAAGPDDPIELKLDGGEGSELVFTGIVSAIRRGLDRVTVTGMGVLGQMARHRPASTFENVSAGTVIRNLADDAGLSAGSIADGVMLRYYAADPSRNATEHATRLAAWSGAMLAAAPNGDLTATIIDATQADIALRYGRELTRFWLDENPAPHEITVAGESGVGDAASDDALRLTTDFFDGNRPQGPGAGTQWEWEPALRTVEASATASAARRRMLSAAQGSGRLEGFLVPRLRPGTVIEVQDLPDNLAGGPYWLDTVRHRITPAGASTTARLMKGGDSFDPLALLGSLGAALGGLL